MPVKLCYLGNTFINSSDYRGRLKESTQCGAELIGDGSISADAEILSMTVESMLESGLKNFQISVGHSQFFTVSQRQQGCRRAGGKPKRAHSK